MRRAAHIDANQPAIVAALEAVGCSVKSTAGMGDGFPDLIVGRAGKTWLIEVKNSAQPPNKRRLRKTQVAFCDWWRGDPVRVVETVDEALAVVAEPVTFFDAVGDY